MRPVVRSLCVALAVVSATAVRLPAQGGPATVVVTPVVEREVVTGHTFVGTVQPLKKATIGSAVEGRVIKFPVNEGDRIAKGQSLAQLMTTTIELELQAAESELAFRQEQLNELKNGTRPEEIAQLRAGLLAAEAKKKFQTARRVRFTALAKQGTVTEDDLETVISATIAAEQGYNSARAGLALAVAGPRKEKRDQAAARVAIQQAVVARFKDQITKYTIVSRFDGYVTTRHTEIGEWVSRGDPVVEVVAIDEVDVETYVLESHVSHLKLGTRARVEILALKQKVLTGTVAVIIPQADTRSRTFPVKVRLKNTITRGIPLIKAGMLARVTLPTGGRQRALLVPKDALVLGGPKPVIYIVVSVRSNKKRSIVRSVSVDLGVASGPLIQVIGSLKAGELVVVEGNERLRPGQEVEFRRSTAVTRQSP